LGGFMREYQAMSNHRVLAEDQKGIFSSPFLWNVFDALPGEKERQSFDVPVFMIAILTSHNMIDTYTSKHAFNARVSTVAHHIFDWMSLTNPMSIYRQSSQKSV